MHQYDEDYRTLISKLNGAFVQKQKEKMVNPAVFEKLDYEKQNFIKSLPEVEIQKIGAKVHSPVTDICFLSQEEKQLVREIEFGRKRSYRQVAFRLVGNIDIEQIMKRYARNIWEEPAFRTVYLYEGLQEPVKVVCENREKTFPVHDVRSMSKDKQNVLVKSVLAAEMRCEYDIQSDFILRIQGYLMADREMTIILSIYPHLPYSEGVNGMLFKVLKGMSPQISDMPVVDENTLKKVNQMLRDESISYWEELMTPLPKSMTIPGENRKGSDTSGRIFGKLFLYKEVGEELADRLNLFCEKNQVSKKAVFLYAWGNMLGGYHGESSPFMAVAQGGEKVDLFPVKVERSEKLSEAMRGIDGQLEKAAKYSNCTLHDMEFAAGVTFSEYFRMVHNFVEFCELDNMKRENNGVSAIRGIRAEDTDINLFISYYLYEKTIAIHYTSQSGIMETLLENLHDLFVEELQMILAGSPTEFNKKTFIRPDDSEEEKLYKIKIAQTGLYLKESGIFDSITVDEIMKLAEFCSLSNYFSNDAVVSEKSAISKIYIVGEGKLEESMTASDGMVKSLRILKKGDIFGVESLFSEALSAHTYTVISQQAQIVEIDKEILTEVFRRKPGGWIALLEKENKLKSKFQYLWTLE